MRLATTLLAIVLAVTMATTAGLAARTMIERAADRLATVTGDQP